MSTIRSPARIAAIVDGVADVRLEPASACGTCGAKGLCGSGHERRLRLPAHPGFRAGDTVSLAMTDADLHRGALVAYLLPATATLLGALLLSAGGDMLAALGAGIGLAAGLAGMRLTASAALGSGVHICHPDSPPGDLP